MACSKCKKDKCCCNNSSTSGSNSQLQAQIAELSEQIDTINTAVLCFIKGHPILELFTPDDVNTFNYTTGLGSGTWAGWGLCNGNSYLNATTNTNTVSPNLIDKFIVGAGGTYAVGDTGGAATVSLVASQNGPHTHTINDAGHTHGVTDNGHDHAIEDPGHTHGGTSAPHGHTLTINNSGPHKHGFQRPIIGGGTYHIGAGTASTIDNGTDNTDDGGIHNHTGVADNAYVVISVTANFTGITETEDSFTNIAINTATTGIVVNNQGSGAPHENLPPFFSLIFAIKI